MILTVTPNAAIDRTYRVEGFALNVVNRPSAAWIVAGGKGINVARTVCRLGGKAYATGILGGHNGRFIATSLREEGIPGRFVWVRGESRTCIAAVDPARRSQTEINEAGPSVPARAWRRLLSLILELAATGHYPFLVLSGSIPPGVPGDFYARVITSLRSLPVKVVLDASGEALQAGAAAGPWMIKPNLLELEQLTGRRARTAGEVRDLAAGLVGDRTEVVLVTMGAAGCVCVRRSSCFHVPAPEVPFLSAVGSGDALLGAVLLALERGWDWRESVRYGVGAGAANACEYGAGFVQPAEVERWAAATVVRSV